MYHSTTDTQFLFKADYFADICVFALIKFIEYFTMHSTLWHFRRKKGF